MSSGADASNEPARFALRAGDLPGFTLQGASSVSDPTPTPASTQPELWTSATLHQAVWANTASMAFVGEMIVTAADRAAAEQWSRFLWYGIGESTDLTDVEQQTVNAVGEAAIALTWPGSGVSFAGITFYRNNVAVMVWTNTPLSDAERWARVIDSRIKNGGE